MEDKFPGTLSRNTESSWDLRPVWLLGGSPVVWLRESYSRGYGKDRPKGKADGEQMEEVAEC